MASMHPFSIAALLGIDSHEGERYASNETDSEACISDKEECHGERMTIMTTSREKAALCRAWSAQPFPLLWYPWMSARTGRQARRSSSIGE